MNATELEYHRFGPWLLEITQEEELPPQYLEKKELILSARLSFKVPVNQDRIKMQAGMLLYKSVVSIFEDHLMILSREIENIEATTIPFKDIIYIAQGGELLINYISIVTTQQEYRINYHSVSFELTRKVIGMLREGIMKSVSQRPIKTLEDERMFQLPLYRSLQNRETLDLPIKILAHQKGAKVKFRDKKNIFNQFKRFKVHELMVATNNKELMIASSDIDRKKRSTVDYSHKIIYAKLESITNIAIVNNEILEGVQDLEVFVEDHKIRFYILESFSSELVLLLN